MTPISKRAGMTFAAAVLGACGLAMLAVDAQANGIRGHRQNADGGVTGGAAHAGTTPNGGQYASGLRYRTDGAGNGSVVSGGAVQGPDGGRGARAGYTTRSADGSVAHQSGFNASGANGSVQSSGSYNRNADGSASGSRDTTATNAAGATYQGNTTYNKGDGVSHTSTCTNAAGAVVPCTR